MLTKLAKISSLLLVSTTLISCLACSSKNDSKQPKSESVTLEATPLKIKRSRQGFAPEKFLAEYDFQKATVQYSLSSVIDDIPACEGTFDFSATKDLWIKAASKSVLCLKTVELTSTDSVIDVIGLYFDKSIPLPNGVRSSESEGYSLVEFYPEPNRALGGEQQYLCEGSFTLDQLLEDAIDCL